uniref:Probable arginine--tRNA ligase, mitochondrial n=1 Tax=Petromyzon marinus TaxID=7757 RepID=S4RT50_PETMA
SCGLRRSLSTQLSRVLAADEEALVPLVRVVPVTKQEEYVLSGDRGHFQVSVRALADGGLLGPVVDVDAEAQSLARKVPCDSVVSAVGVQRQGLLGFTVDSALLTSTVLRRVEEDGECFGATSELFSGLPRERIIIEYSSPNIAKKFHAGHLRSTIIGNFLANLHDFLRHDVIRMNYLGDWGMQFGMLGAGFQRFGSTEHLERNPIQHLFEVYVQANRAAKDDPALEQEARIFLRSLEDGGDEALSLWRKFRALSVENYSMTYQRLAVRFDEYSGESLYRDKAQDVVSRLKELGLFTTTEQGTGVVDLSPGRDMTSLATLTRSDGSSLYLTSQHRDIAAAVDRMDRYCFDKMVYVTDKGQEGHFRQVFETLRLMGNGWTDRCVHVGFGLVQGMKTRRGDVVFLEDVLDEAQARMRQNMDSTSTTKELDDPEGTAEKLGIAAIIIQDFQGDLKKGYKFDWARVLQSRGDTGVFLQYTHARLCSLERSCGVALGKEFSPSHLQESPAPALVQHLMRYDEAVEEAACELQPRPLVQFLFTLSSRLAAVAHRNLPVKGMPSDLAQARLHLFVATRSVLARGLRLLGIVPVDRM